MMQGFWNLASYTGLVSDGSQPELDCAWPLKTLESPEQMDEMSERHFAQATGLLRAPDWEVVKGWKDPEAANGGDVHLWNKPQVGRYHHMKITMSLKNATTKQVLELALSDTLEGRKQFSADIVALEPLEKSKLAKLEYAAYSAPPPVAGRDFCLLQGRREVDNGTIMAFGCSVDSAKCPDDGSKGFVRAVCFFCWELVPVGDHVMVTYVNCLDPRGWTPPFMMAWLKGAATQEFINIRAVLSGKKADLHQLEMKECGVSEEEMKKAIAEKDQEKPQE